MRATLNDIAGCILNTLSRLRYFDVQRFGGLQVDDGSNFRRLRHWQVRRLLAFEDAAWRMAAAALLRCA